MDRAIMMTQKRIAEILNKGLTGDKWSARVDLALAILILANLIAVVLESIEPLNNRYGSYFSAFELFSVSIFVIEYLLRVWSAPQSNSLDAASATAKRLSYITSFTGLIDLLAILPTLLQSLIPGADLRWLRAIRMIRLLKISHYSSALEDLISAIYHERRSFGAAIYLFGIALFLASTTLYLAENHMQPDAFGSIPESMWWAIITLTTVGYGDVSPITPIGKIIGSVTAVMGVCSVALLTGIVGSAFSNQLAKRRAIFEAEVGRALADGTISDEEALYIERLRKEFNLPEEHARAIVTSLTEQFKNDGKLSS
jgi:voltage-gated potassium channel